MVDCGGEGKVVVTIGAIVVGLLIVVVVFVNVGENDGLLDGFGDDNG